MSTSNLATTYLRLGRYQEAASVRLDALTFTREVRAIRPNDALLTAMMIDHLTGIASAQIELGRTEDVPSLLDEADALLETLVDAGPTAPARDVPGLRDQIRELRDRLSTTTSKQ